MIALTHFLDDGVRASSAAIALLFAGWLSLGIAPVTPVLAYWLLLAQGIPTLPPNESLIEFAMRQGGAFAILVIVLWFYRRDYRDLVAFRTERDKILVEMVEKSTRAATDMANAIRENNVIVHQAKNVLRDYLPQRREGEIQ